MRIGVVHNYYQWPGGEDSVFEAECALLERHGHDVRRYAVHNQEISSRRAKVLATFAAVWSWRHFRMLKRFIREQQIDVLHVHNFFPLISPAVFWAASSEGVPVVFTVHNYRLGCLNGKFYKEGDICRVCESKALKYAGVAHRCYKNSYIGSLAVAIMLSLHRALGTWTRKVTAYIALTEFARTTLEREGVPKHRIIVKPNFVFPAPAVSREYGDHFLFMGRHFQDKGIATLLAAWQQVEEPVRLVVLGEGPLTDDLRRMAGDDARIEFRGHVPAAERDQLRRSARAVIFPSLWFEGFPMVIAESLAVGVPVISSRLGAMKAILTDGLNALLFEPGNAQELARAISLLSSDSDLLARLRAGARKTADDHFRAEQNANLLGDLYGRLKEGSLIHA